MSGICTRSTAKVGSVLELRAMNDRLLKENKKLKKQIEKMEEEFSRREAETAATPEAETAATPEMFHGFQSPTFGYKAPISSPSPCFSPEASPFLTRISSYGTKKGTTGQASDTERRLPDFLERKRHYSFRGESSAEPNEDLALSDPSSDERDSDGSGDSPMSDNYNSPEERETTNWNNEKSKLESSSATGIHKTDCFQHSSEMDEDEGLERDVAALFALALQKYERRLKLKSADVTKGKERIQMLEQELAFAKEKLKMVDAFEEQKQHMQELQERLAEGELLRKKLHNTILELKGNIRVFCRVRPLLPDDGGRQEASVIAYPTSTESLGRGIDVVQSGNKHTFTFDKVFDHGASQEEVFFEISQLVQSALDGYKVCIFAYGQTGSGKTYTMMGRPETPGQKGLIPRSLEQIFKTSQSLSVQGWKHKMQVSMLEIYNESIRDLLSTNRTIAIESVRADSSTSGRQYTITHDVNGNTHVSDLTIVDVCSIGEISSLLQQAAHRRSVGKTHMNEQSSRSHFVFTLRISGVNESTEQQVQGVLNLIDLAGSERLSRSGAAGERLKGDTGYKQKLVSFE